VLFYYVKYTKNKNKKLSQIIALKANFKNPGACSSTPGRD
jgi:hypothetical protein